MVGVSQGISDKCNSEDLAYRQILHTHLTTLVGELCLIHGIDNVKLAISVAEKEYNEETVTQVAGEA